MADELTCVLTALRREGMYLRAGTRRVHGGPCPAWRRDGVLLVQSGMGAAATERALTWALGCGVTRVIAAGFCGALADVPVGTAVWFDEVCECRGASFQLAWVGAHDGKLETCPTRERLVSVDHPVLTSAARLELRERTGAVCVDMESAAASRVCHDAGVPFACVRAVSDAADLPPELAVFADGERVHALRLLGRLLRRPSLALDLLRLARDSRRAARALADALRDQVGAVASSSAG